MIGYLEGTARNSVTGTVIVAGGVGWAVRCPQLPEDGAPLQLWVTTVVRENDITLYGFATVEEQLLFDALRGAHRVGPSVALAILAEIGVGGAVDAILAQNPAPLRAAKGVGPAAAKSIVDNVKLPEVLLAAAGTATPAPAAPEEPADEFVATLIGLGFSAPAATSAVDRARQLHPAADDSEMLSLALANMNAEVA